MGAMVGTPSSMAPEQFLGAEIDRRVDIYACGVLLYQLLVGKPPFSGRTEALMYSVVYEEPVLPSAVPGYTGPRQYDALLARALAKKPDQRFASAAAFRQALLEVVGRPVPATVSDETIIALPPRGASRAGAPAGPGSASGRSTGLGTPTSWSPVVLGQVEATLARHVGPLASVLVRRTARECADLPSLVARLADQMTDASARQAFLAAAAPSSRSNQGRVATGGSSGGTREGGPSSAATSAVSDAWVAQATRLLAAEVGPIAGVLVKRTVASARGRDAVVSALADAAPAGAARDRLRAALLKLV
jgi:serine/threonine-protein kinase